MSQSGSGIKDILKGVHKIVKEKRLISRGLSHFGMPRASGVAGALGYGRRRRVRRRRQTGGISIPGAVIGGLKGLFGLGRKRRVRRRL